MCVASRLHSTDKHPINTSQPWHFKSNYIDSQTVLRGVALTSRWAFILPVRFVIRHHWHWNYWAPTATRDNLWVGIRAPSQMVKFVECVISRPSESNYWFLWRWGSFHEACLHIRVSLINVEASRAVLYKVRLNRTLTTKSHWELTIMVLWLPMWSGVVIR